MKAILLNNNLSPPRLILVPLIYVLFTNYSQIIPILNISKFLLLIFIVHRVIYVIQKSRRAYPSMSLDTHNIIAELVKKQNNLCPVFTLNFSDTISVLRHNGKSCGNNKTTSYTIHFNRNWLYRNK